MTEQINDRIREHVSTVPDWEHAGLVTWLHDWAALMITEFGLGITCPVIAIERCRKGVLGTYRFIRNALGLQDEIAISTKHATTSPRWEVLGTLLHELLHEWQCAAMLARDIDKIPRRNYHDKQLREKAASLGLDITARGVTSYQAGETPFRVLLAREGVDLDEVAPAEEEEAPRSKLALWVCKCLPTVKLRIGRKDLRVQCLDCGQPFMKK